MADDEEKFDEMNGEEVVAQETVPEPTAEVAQAETPEILPEPSKPPKLSKNNLRTILIASAAVVLLAAAGYFVFTKLLTKNAPTGVTKDSLVASVEAAEFSNYIPSSLDIRGTVVNDGAEWIVGLGMVAKIEENEVKFYTEKDGLSTISATSIMVHDGTVWVSTDDGVSRYDKTKDRFDTYLTDIRDGTWPEGLANSALFEDKASNTLMVTDFETSFRYDDSTDEWIEFTQSPAPINVRSDVVSSSTELIATGWQTGSVNLLRYDNQSKSWEDIGNSELTDQSDFLALVDDRIVSYGRSADYDDSNGEEASVDTRFSLFYEYNPQTKSWVELSNLNSQFEGTMVHPRMALSGDTTMFVASDYSSENGDGIRLYKFEIKNNKVVATVVEDSEMDADGIEGRGQQAELQQKLFDLTGLYPLYSVVGSTGSGDLLVKYSDINSESYEANTRLGVVKDSFAEITELALPKTNNVNMPILCGSDKLFSYVLSGVYDDFGGWRGLDLYPVNSDYSLGQMVPLTGDELLTVGIDYENYICNDANLYWLGSNAVKKMDRKTTAVSDIAQLAKYDIQSDICGPVISSADDKYLAFNNNCQYEDEDYEFPYFSVESEEIGDFRTLYTNVPDNYSIWGVDYLGADFSLVAIGIDGDEYKLALADANYSLSEPVVDASGTGYSRSPIGFKDGKVYFIDSIYDSGSIVVKVLDIETNTLTDLERINWPFTHGTEVSGYLDVQKDNLWIYGSSAGLMKIDL